MDMIGRDCFDIPNELLSILLLDRTTSKNICWATDHYQSCGEAYAPDGPITTDLVTGQNAHVLKSRLVRTRDENNNRTKKNGEVFTPAWVCNEQNNIIDETWFGRKNVFNTPMGKNWAATKGPIEFPKNKTWEQYVDDKRMEITCGEAPYLSSRYDTVTGQAIPLEERIGLLDRKLRIVNENVDSEDEWQHWAQRAYESIYGYEYQGDNLLIARANLLHTFIENMEHKFSKQPESDRLALIAIIISWNIWQMDGITMTAPHSKRPKMNKQLSLFEIIDLEGQSDTEPIPCRIFDWRSNNSLEFKSLLRGET